MKVIIALLTGTALVIGAAQAQNDRREGQQQGDDHGKAPRPKPGTHPEGQHANPSSQPGAPHRREASPGPDRMMNRDTQRPLGDPDGRPSFDRGRRPDFSQFHGNFHAERRYHAAPWHPPRDYHYQRWTYGQRLPALYFGSSFWITRFGLYGLMAPPPDTVWVRSGPDALLVDRDTGEIIRVQYDVFY